MSLTTVIVLVSGFFIAAYAVILYNGLVRLKHGVGKAWANIDVLLRQRHEELPKLVETCKQYMLMLENEVQELTLQLRKAREDIFGLVQMNGQLSNEKSKLKIKLGAANTQIERLRAKTSEQDRQVRSLLLIKDQRDYLLRKMGIHNDIKASEQPPSA